MTLVSLFLGAILGAAPPDEGPPNPSGLRSTWGIVVGIEAYPHLKIEQRTYARQDAAALHRFLTAPEGMGAPAAQIRLLTDRPDEYPGALLATADNLRSAFAEIAKSAAPDDLLFIFLKISGLPEGAEFRWLGCDASPEKYARTSILSSELTELLERVRCHWCISCVDVCFEEPARSLGLDQLLATADWDNTFAGLVGPGRFVFSANDARFAAPIDNEKKSGIFAEVLLAGLGGAMSAPEPVETWITVPALWSYLEKQVPYRAKELWGNDRHAQPVRAGDPLLPQLCIAVDRKALPIVEGRLATLKQLAAQKEITDSQLVEGQRLLQGIARSTAERSLRDAYIGLISGKVDRVGLETVQQMALAQQSIDPAEARKFAEAILEARNVIARNYVRPEQGNPALRAGVIGLFRHAAQPVPPAIAEGLSKLDAMTADEVVSLLMKVRMFLGVREDLPGEVARDECLTEMFQSLDPHSRYIPKRDIEKDRRSVDGDFAGLGLQVSYNATKKVLEVISPVFGSAAYRSGIRGGDQIIAIDGRRVETLSEKDSLAELSGPRGKVTKLTVVRPDGKQEEREVKFSEVKIETVVGVYREANDSWNFWLDPEAGIAYIRINTFDGHTADDFRRTLSKLRKERHLSGLVLDLRFNRGGLVKAATDVASMFVQGEIVTMQYPDRDVSHQGRDFFRFDDFPVALLINGESASSSEIVAAALVDHERGVVIGDRSFGKGSTQDILELKSSEGAIRLTTALARRPNGKLLHRGSKEETEDSWGVTPDPAHRVPMLREDAQRLLKNFRAREIISALPQTAPSGFEKDPQLQKAVEWLTSRRKSANTAGR